jgi:hypothetical protein
LVFAIELLLKVGVTLISPVNGSGNPRITQNIDAGLAEIGGLLRFRRSLKTSPTASSISLRYLALSRDLPAIFADMLKNTPLAGFR